MLDCQEDRRRTTEAFQGFSKALDRLSDAMEARHLQNRKSIAGIYALLWAAVGTMTMTLLAVIGFLLTHPPRF